MRRLALALLSAVLLTPSLAPAGTGGVTIAAIGAHLLYSGNGAQSENIAAPSNFAGWNVIVGEGANGPANDVLVTVLLTSPADELNVSTPLTLTARTAGGKVLGQRVYRHILIKGGKAVEFLLLPDATCAGHIKLQATLGRQTRSGSVDLDCGE